MNWLAHIFISRNCIDYQLGNLLADPLKGKCWEGAGRQVEEGFRMHGSIDSFTDSNPFVLKSKSRLGRKGYLKGVIVDIAYDYSLLNNWDRYSKIDLECFIDSFYRQARAAIEKYPDEAREFVERVIDAGVLTSYGSLSGLDVAFRRIDNRLSERLLARESASGYLPVLKDQMAGIEEDFIRFFPQLVEHFKSNAGEPLGDHWLK